MTVYLYWVAVACCIVAHVAIVRALVLVLTWRAMHAPLELRAAPGGQAMVERAS